MSSRRQFICGIGCLCQQSLATGQIITSKNLERLNQNVHSRVQQSSGCLLSEYDFDTRNIKSHASLPVESTSRDTLDADAVAAPRAFNYTVVASSGDRDYDRALAESLFYMSELFGVLPTFGFIQNARLPNAYATTAIYRAEGNEDKLPSRLDGTVLVADTLLGWLANKGIDDPVAASLAICAHEFAHIAQYRYSHQGQSIVNWLTDGQPGIKKMELHADYLAGYYVGMARLRNPETPAATVAYATYVIGDFNVDSEQHHGTPDERGQAVANGYQQGFVKKATIHEALLTGLRYVQVTN